MNDTLENIAIGAFESIALCFRVQGRKITKKDAAYIMRALRSYLNGATRYDIPAPKGKAVKTEVAG